jgi:acetoin utilization deacetylase AcuC-like enzyme
MLDTPVSSHSFDTARLAAGGLLALLDEVMAGRLRNGFAMVRPPGHHAERDRAMGFCLFNNVAIGAAYLRARHGLERVLVVDWDVHHGNGTQHSFARDPGVLYASTHRYPFYPGTGALDEIGQSEGAGFTLNIPFPGGFGDAEYLEAFRTVIEPIALQYAPQFVLISAGFDPHQRDPLGGMGVSEPGFAAMARSLIGVAEQVAGGRCVAVLEGGYDLRATRDSARAVLDELRGEPSHPPPSPTPSSARPILDAVRKEQRDFWKF